MPITKTIDHEKELTTVRGTGDLTYDEIMEHLKAFWEGDQQTRHILWDVRNGNMKSLTIEDFQRFARDG